MIAAMSALPRGADIVGAAGHVGLVPPTECGSCEPKRMLARRRLFSSNPMIVDQAAITVGFDLRRWAMKPTPVWLRSSMGRETLQAAARSASIAQAGSESRSPA